MKAHAWFLALSLAFSSLLLADTHPYYRGEGHAVGGGASISGLLKSLIIPNAIPVGRLSSFHGYEVWDFTSAKESIKGHNRASFCYSSMELSQDLGLIGVAFGGEGARVKPIGQCPKNLTAVAGEDLTFSIAYEVGKGSKSVPVGVTFSYGFDLSVFTETMMRHFTVNNPFKRKPSERMSRMFTHLMKYLALKGTKNIVDPTQSLLLKLFISTSLMSKKDGMKAMKFSNDELDIIGKIGSKSIVAFNRALSDAFRNIQRDADFYFCRDLNKCQEIYVDFLEFADAVESSMSDCHTISTNVALQNDYSITLVKGFKVEVGFGYTVTAADKIFTSKLPTSVLAAKEFARHRLSSHSASCKETPKKSAEVFANFLVLMGYGKQK